MFRRVPIQSEALQRVAPEHIVCKGRVYDGGLHKVESKELAQIPATLTLEELDVTAVVAGERANSEQACISWGRSTGGPESDVP